MHRGGQAIAPRSEHDAEEARPSVAAAVSRRRAVALDRVHDLAMLAVLALHRDGNNAMNRRHQKQQGEEPPEDEAEYDQQHVEYGREWLAVEQQTERRQKKRQDVYHLSLQCPGAAERRYI